MISVIAIVFMHTAFHLYFISFFALYDMHIMLVFITSDTQCVARIQHRFGMAFVLISFAYGMFVAQLQIFIISLTQLQAPRTTIHW